MPHRSPRLVADPAQLCADLLRNVTPVLREVRPRHNEPRRVEQQRRVLTAFVDLVEQAGRLKALRALRALRALNTVSAFSAPSALSALLSQSHPHHRQRGRDRLVLAVELRGFAQVRLRLGELSLLEEDVAHSL